MTTGTSTSQAFSSLLDVHERLDNLFASHQEALVGGELGAAGRILREFRILLERHMNDEEEVLIPVYRRAGPIAGGGEELYLAEHRKLKKLLDKIEVALQGLHSATGPRRREIVELLDQECRFKNLLAHHGERERNILYPTLDRITAVEERTVMLGRCVRPVGLPPAPAEPPESPFLHVTRDGVVVRIELDRAPLNVLNIEMLDALNARLEHLCADESLVAVVFSARGKSFSAGVEVAEHLPDQAERMLRVFGRTFRLLQRLEAVTIAAVHGAVLGGGCELALFCDMVLAADNAKIGQPEIKLATVAPVASALLPRLCGPKAAAELLLTGDVIDAHTALRLGLVNKVVAAEELPAALDSLLQKLAALSSVAVRLGKRALREDTGFWPAMERADRICLEMLTELPDTREGLTAFLEKRPPRWSV
jgi:cyclohexa-1,5-dienecarbonyl-CoA hydratase